MPIDILLVTQNARYHHAAFGIRYLKANLGELEPRCALLESTIKEPAADLVEKILAARPRVVGLSVYIWNASNAREVLTLLKQLKPELPVVLGGPEVSYELDQPLVELADYVVTGEGDLAFAELCHRLLAGERPAERIVVGGRPPTEKLQLPYHLYEEDDLAHRVVYVEASRGCPFRCEFCLSSLDPGVRAFSLERFLEAMEQLHRRGLRRFKFVDRTFNLKVETGRAILNFFRQRLSDDLFLHFEMIPDRLPEGLREPLASFPPGTLQFEIGIQTFDPEVSARISRRQNYERLEENFRFLRTHTGVHVHADLIVGLPGETLDGFATGFDRLVALDPQEIQVGILKRLRGTPIVRHDQQFAMVYSQEPPYELLRNSTLDFATMQQMKRFARFWDLVANQGRFPETLKLLLGDSAFANFFAFSEFLHAQGTRTFGVSPTALARQLHRFLGGAAEAALRSDLEKQNRQLPPFLRRQARHSDPSPAAPEREQCSSAV